jgi:hypothetical protein
MSKYEPRAHEIKSRAAERGWKISWRRIRHRIYVTADTKGGNPLAGEALSVYEFLCRYYKNPEITSGGFGRWNFMVCDLIAALKDTGHD